MLPSIVRPAPPALARCGAHQRRVPAVLPRGLRLGGRRHGQVASSCPRRGHDPEAFSAVDWHAPEMIFGFGAFVAGFLLTAIRLDGAKTASQSLFGPSQSLGLPKSASLNPAPGMPVMP